MIILIMESFQMSQQLNEHCGIIGKWEFKDVGQIKCEIEPSTLYDSYVECQRKDYLEWEEGEKIIWTRREEKVL